MVVTITHVCGQWTGLLGKETVSGSLLGFFLLSNQSPPLVRTSPGVTLAKRVWAGYGDFLPGLLS